MKQFLLLALIISATLSCAAQQPACKAFHTGTFQMTSPNGVTTRITRSDSRQTELMSNSTHPTDYTIKWLNDCTYVLIPEASFFAKYPQAPRNGRLTVHITSTTSKGYSIEATFNFSDEVMRSTVVRVK